MKHQHSLTLLPLAALTVLAWFALSVSTAQAAAIAGDNIKCEAFPSVYFLGEDGARHAYPNEKIYFSHYADFEGVKTVSCATLATLPLGSSVQYDAGKRLIKAPSVPVVYAVTPAGVLRPLKNEEQAREIYGDDWAKKVDDISEVFLSQYTVGAEHPEHELVEGTVLVGADGKLLRADASGFAVEVEDLVDVVEKEMMKKDALDVTALEARLGKTILKISVSARSADQVVEYRLKYKVVPVGDEDKETVEVDEATEAEKEADHAELDQTSTSDNVAGSEQKKEDSAGTKDEGTQGHADDTTVNSKDDTTTKEDGGVHEDAAGTGGAVGDTAGDDSSQGMEERSVTPLTLTASLLSTSPSGPAGGPPGPMEVLDFSLLANGTGAGMKQISFTVITTDTASTKWNYCGDGASALFADPARFALYSGLTGYQYDTAISWTFYDVTGAPCGVNPVQLGFAVAQVSGLFAMNGDTYALGVDTSGISAVQDDTIRVDIAVQPDFIWFDGVQDQNGTSVLGLPLTGGTIIY
ncbi:hypothetical protein COV06_04085 [Candidatus Uhrbacteria bacterium CG10_big_fil_rev_8_21_14_0_10_50_16]|uniref:Uncharacterized protein n=1 Tax=Candidatus Uhrbacteria bacterium CG10_big_fil_rev_8_21_14_0_10_50_16 TaxID=1975039 RepID=A0A2H0RL11_9BACT|nr:MAG: hypothetical protein COV06_04085 [Candidatus Uhrbacteria bacterium CG10_big_fil_rev_8_21_14_0_10_50_16]